MNNRIRRIGTAFAFAAIAVALLLAACAAPAAPPPAPAPTVAQPTAAPAQPTAAPAQPTTAPAQPTAAPTEAPSSGGTDRANTLILDTEGGKVADAKNFNPYAGGRGGSNGVVQALTEPVFTTNLVTGKIEPWLADSMTPKEDFTRWTLKLKKGIEWSDGQPLTADDVLFTVAMIQKFPDLALPYKFKDVTAKKIDDQTVEFTLPQSDPRWQLTVWSSNLQSQEVKLVPEHIWK